MSKEVKILKTKDRILLEALNLFSKDGYEGVSIKQIADAVGIKDSSLYKHYTSKKEIYESILVKMKEDMGELGMRLHLPDIEDQKYVQKYGELTVETLTDITKQAFLFYLKDEIASKCRRMLIIEQYRNPDAGTLYQKIFLEDSIKYLTLIFRSLINARILKQSDPELIALYYYTPIYYLLARYDAYPEKEEEALSYIDRHVQEFYRLYHKS
ncbi:MAG: TetR/AcrR family transcriptional regulator [Lachnospiraceae bacterium]|nr:TetR/AcrR family transcriptional regulator [Lachnospiraceae bacterium]